MSNPNEAQRAAMVVQLQLRADSVTDLILIGVLDGVAKAGVGEDFFMLLSP